jgi:alkyl hydroperoxide reductase subunit AhpF
MTGDEQPLDSVPGERPGLDTILGYLPERVLLKVWASSDGNAAEVEAIRLVRELGESFATLDCQLFERPADFPYSPIIGVLGYGQEGELDHGIRLIGLPLGYQFTSLLAAIQCVSFRGMTSEARTRIALRRLQAPVTLELITGAEDEAGPVMAQTIFNLAVGSEWIRSYLIMGDGFPQALVKNSVRQMPHLVINDRVHVEGVIDEARVLAHIGRAVRRSRG